MKCPMCDSDMIKQTTGADLWVIDKPDGFLSDKADYWDAIAEWFKCSNVNCPMAVYLSNEEK